MFSPNFYNNYGLLLNDKPYYQIIIVLFILIAISSNNILDFFLLLTINSLGLYMIYIIKLSLKTKRPIDCEKNKLDYCPDSYDIPSGHCFIAILWIMILVTKKNKYTYPIILYLLLIPPSRYFGKLHTIEAVLSGLILGFGTFLIYSVFSS